MHKKTSGGTSVRTNLPFIITEFVAVVISWNNVDKKDVFGFGVHPSHFDLVARKHPPVKQCKSTPLDMLLF